MSKHVIEFDCQCESCDGTGVYKGFAEREGAAVQCNHCGGTGKDHVKLEYTDFDARKRRMGIKRVFECNPGFGLGPESLGGMPYADWFKGEPFPRGSETRQLVCPRWWWQCAGGKGPEPKCADFHFGEFKSCPHFASKAECWAKWDAAKAGSSRVGG